MQKLKMCLAQMEVKPGQIRENTNTVLNMIAKAKKDGSEIICLSELCLSGYILGDMWERRSFIDECVDCGEEVIKASDGIIVIFGNIATDPDNLNEDGRIRKYNTVQVAKDGRVVDMVIKSLQPNYREFDDNRHFYDFRKVMFGQICEYGLEDDSSEAFLSRMYPHSITTDSGICHEL